jgi:GTPase SAR1 family protein
MGSLPPHVSQDETAPPSASPSKQAELDFSALKQLLSTKKSSIKQLLDDLKYTVTSDIELPCIVACGDQSSGKSSVLEAISRLDFPRDEETCTKFATELSLCGKPGQDVTAVSTNIRWHDSIDGAKSTPRPTTLQKLPRDINEAYAAMAEHNGSQSCSFFKDVLCIQATHAGFPDLTLIDLPGIIHNGKRELDNDTVLDIIKGYLRQKKTIILAVVYASRDAQAHAILDLVKKYDPDGKRTMGIITMPDRVEEGSNLCEHWIRIARGDDPDYRFAHGWHVVRNRGPRDSALSFEDRDRQEQSFFEKRPWRELDPSRLGVAALRTHLSQIFDAHTEAALPAIYRELKQQEDYCEEELKRLGTSRNSLQDQIYHLTGISVQFHGLTSDAVKGRNDCLLLWDGENTFCSLLYEQYMAFAVAMHQYGHTFEMSDDGPNDYQQKRAPPPMVSLTGQSQLFPHPERKTRQELLDWIQKLCGTRRGRQLGLPDPLNINRAFREQSKNWRMIAEAYLNSVWNITRDLLLKAVMSSVTDAGEHTAEGLIINLINPEMEHRKERVRQKLNEILRPYESLCAISTDPEFLNQYEAIQKAYNDREIPDLAKHILSTHESPESPSYINNLNMICASLSSFKPKAPVHPSGPASLLTLMQLYYQVWIPMR